MSQWTIVSTFLLFSYLYPEKIDDFIREMKEEFPDWITLTPP